MAFSNYKSISTVIKNFQIKYVQSNFILEVSFPVEQSFKDELDLLFTDGVIDNSEDAICENLIYPVLKLFAAVNYIFQQCELKRQKQ
ncbi:MAG: hypothetical protein V7L31_01070 [Nostoc sp.]|uniref:hypothetical protein n=1 Tax=Nostoc sp. TaxID=1180 RepID=UPI002FF0DCC3